MIKVMYKRLLPLLLATIMIVSALPLHAFAAESHDAEHTEHKEEVATTPSDMAKDMATSMTAILERYGVNAKMTDAEIKATINAQPWSVNKPTISEISQIEAMIEDLTDVDSAYVIQHADVETFIRFRDIFKPMFAVVKAASGTYTPVNGVSVSVSGASDNSWKNSELTVTAKGSGGIFGIGASAKTATIKISNDSGSKAKISFSWTASSVNELKIDGKVTGGTSGSFEKVMEAGESFTITITTAKNSTTNKLVMKNFACAAVQESSKVTFRYDSDLGSITVAGNATSSGATMDIPVAGVEVKATAKNGASFLGWMDADTHMILSSAATYKLEPANDMTVKAVFTKNACFFVDGKLYESLNEALDAAKTSTGKTIVLANNGILSAGDYTIPSDVTLLIPFNDANTLCTTAPVTTDASFSAPTVYRKMTMAEGANIIVNGALSLSATQSASGGQSSPIGKCSFIEMESGSTITVNNGGKLYAWGYIQGSGSVTVEKGGTVYECFQVKDWRGGDNTSGMIGNSYRVFPMSQYYIQNIEVPMTLKAGATENGYMSVAISLVGIQGSEVPFIGTNGMFNITEGYVVKDYDESTGRLKIDMHGSLSVKSLSLSMKLGLIGTKTINSKDYVLPINGNMDITMHSGSVTMTQDIALHPGARLIVGKDATCTLGNGNKIYVYDYDQWTTEVAADAVHEGPSFCGTGDATHVNLLYPDSAKNVVGRDQDAYVEINGVADLSAGYVYTTASGANICGTGTIIMRAGTEAVTYQVKHTGSDDKTEKWVSIPIISAKLTNADGSLVETAGITGVVTYKSVDGVWTCEHSYTETFTGATCTQPGMKTFTCNCGHSYTEEIAASGHSYSTNVTAPTCTEKGYTTYTCTTCGDSYDADYVDATGHTEVIDAAVAPTCTATGLTEGKHCSVCGVVTVKQTVVAALGHTEVIDAAVAATCTTTGLTEGKHCSVCGVVTVKQDVVPSLGHTEVIDDAVAPTCTATGLTEGKHCSVCGVVTVEQNTVAILGHTEVVDPAVAPTCTATGLTEGKHCSVCGTVLKEQTVVAVKEHAWEWVTDKEATVLASGLKHEECSDCHAKQNENTVIPVLACAHTGSMAGTAAVEATCTAEGNSAYWYCTACHKYYSDASGQHQITEGSWVIPAKGHDHKSSITPPTCTEDGYTTYTCACGDSYVKDVVAAKGHVEIVDNKVAPTCTATGLTEGKHCYVCNKVLVKQEVVDALGHNYSTAVTAPDCIHGGYTTYTCTVCGDEHVDDHVDANGHDYASVDTKATCTEGGYTTYTCTVCGDEYVADYVDAKGHGYESQVTAPTCTADGYTTHTCTVCGNSYVDSPVDAIGHDYSDYVTTPATCKEDGSDVRTCQREGCGAVDTKILPMDPDAHKWGDAVPYKNHSCNSYGSVIYECEHCGREREEITQLQHTRVPIAEEIPATCTQDGMTSGWKCEKCYEFWIPQEVIPALGHDWGGAYPCQSASSACTREGCDLHFDAKQEHLVVTLPAMAATCTSTGLTEGAYCGYCGEILVAQTETPVIDHTFMVADMEIPARCGVAGHKEGATYCIYCEYDEDAIPALDHTWVHRDAKKPSYTVVGWNDHDYCLLCNAVKPLEEYENDPCEYCGENPEGYMELPKYEIQSNKTLDDFLYNLELLEQMAEVYVFQNPGEDPLALVLNYMRTAVANYTTGSWAIMAGPEHTDFFKFVQEMEDTINNDPELNVMINVSGLKKLSSVKNTHGEKNVYTNDTLYVMSGHFFGTMDMTYHNKGSQNHADVGGWVGDLTDLLSISDEKGVPANLSFEEKVEYIRNKYLFKNNIAGSAGSFGASDLYADLEAYYFMNELVSNGYETGDLVKLMRQYYRTGLTLEQRVAYLLDNRLDGLSTRQDLRTAVYNAYTGNKLIATLEGTRDFNSSGNELAELRKAVCYAFADEMCLLAGDYVEDLTNDRFTVFDTETKILAPGISQQISYATNADGKQIVFYIATADVKRDDVGVWVNYYDRDPGTPENPIWKNNSVISSAQNAQDRYGDPNSPDYIENFNVIASTNAGGYDMSDVATPGGLMVMDGVEWYPQKGSAGFFAILSDGTAYMGTSQEYESMMSAGLIKEAIGGFGDFVVKDGKVVGSATYSDAPRTSVGITATGRVVLMCVDGRQAPFSSGASLQDMGYIMKEAGCVVAINLDGGGSTTFVARQPGSDDLEIMNRPSDGYPRNVSTNLLIYSTAPSSTAFDHAIVESKFDYATIGTAVQMTASGVSPSGSAVEVPEGAYWVVANEEFASITADGVFVGKSLGEVNVYLMLGEETIGIKRMTITNPDQLYFERNKVDAIYGSSVVLPLCGRIEGKPIAINPDDVTFLLSAPAAGTMDGFAFKSVESTVKSLTITASIGEDISASINVMLYKQGENSFDFENATGGDRMLAWFREVSNATVEDGNIYNVVDPSQDMVIKYTFAMDMTTIPVPERLKELTYMLPGGTLEGATAWSFLLSLAQRISDMSWVRATIKFDERFVVDYSELVIHNEYFTMKDLSFDETTNTLTVTMNWIKQSQVIDEATANPLCLIKGIKLTPKDGVWSEDVTKINAVMTGNISYEIYMRASGLYGFAQKPESQAVFGLYPYRNPNDTSDAGGYFKDTYAEITDNYTLVNVLKNGWVNEDGGFAYYVDNVRYTGVQKVDGFYYDFGEKGINVGQSKYTGLFYDESVSAYRYAYQGSLASGWQMINNEWYYFDSSTMKAVVGKKTISHVPYEFEETGKLVSGVWMNVFVGYRYYYGPDYVRKGWYQINGDWYYFKDAFALTGTQLVASQEMSTTKRWYYFDENGVSQGLLTGIVDNNGKLYYVENGKATEKGLFVFNGDYYCTIYDGSLIVNQQYYAWLIDSSSALPKGHYRFGPDGKMLGGSIDEETGGISGIVEVDGKLYYYENGKPTEKGLFKYNGEYYFNHYNGELVVNEKYYAWKLDATSELPKGHYEFGPDGRMLNGIIEKNDKLYYYENGQPKEKGLFLYNGDYYFSHYDGSLVVDQKYYAWKHDVTSIFTNGHYVFGADGKMCQGIVSQNGILYYYENGKTVDKGLFLYSDGYHYFADVNGILITSKSFYAWKVDGTSLLEKATYEFDAEGRVIGSSLTGEIVNKNGVLYYYEAGHPIEKGLFKFNGDYYYSQYDGKLITDQKYYAWKHDATSELKNDHYEFDAEGKMLQGIVRKGEKLYYYENGKPTEKGLFQYNGDYYFTHYDGEMVVGQNYYAWKHDVTSNFANGHYEFDSEGKMVQGFYEKNGKLYYYEDGKPVEKGLFVYNGDYYFTHYDGEVVVNQKYYAWKLDVSSELPKGHYWFDESGKLIGSSKDGEIVNINGKLYYYECGQPVEKGVFMVDGYYYYAQYDGSLIVNQKYYVWRDNEYLMVNHYTFNEIGQIVG